MSTQPHIAIAILNYNGKKYLEQYLSLVLETTYQNKSVWLIDNQSTDGSIDYLKANFPSVNVIINSGNLGFADGYNQGLQSISADYYLLLNSDIEVTPNFIEPVIELMEGNPDIAFAQPKMRWLRQRELFEYAGAAGGTMDGLGYPFCRGRILEIVEPDNGQYDDDAPVFWASGACLFAKANVYKEMNGMYGFFFMQNEEIDLCWRAQNLGYKIYACGKSMVYHLGGGSLEWNNPQKTFFTFRNNLVLNARNMPIGRLFWMLPIRFALDMVASLRYMLSGKYKIGYAVVGAWWTFFKWLFFYKDKQWPKKRGLKNCAGVYHGSIVWNYFVLKRRKYSELNPKRNSK